MHFPPPRPKDEALHSSSQRVFNVTPKPECSPTCTHSSWPIHQGCVSEICLYQTINNKYQSCSTDAAEGFLLRRVLSRGAYAENEKAPVCHGHGHDHDHHHHPTSGAGKEAWRLQGLVFWFVLRAKRRAGGGRPKRGSSTTNLCPLLCPH